MGRDLRDAGGVHKGTARGLEEWRDVVEAGDGGGDVPAAVERAESGGAAEGDEFPGWECDDGGLARGTKRDWGLGGLLVMQDLEGWRSKGTMTGGGMPNLTWIDREAGICGLYASQILPPGDLKSVEMSALFEKTMYERYSEGEVVSLCCNTIRVAILELRKAKNLQRYLLAVIYVRDEIAFFSM